jgi:hypothetical protein
MTQPPPSHVRTFLLGVLVEEERLDSPWQDHRWRVAAVLADPPPAPESWQPFAAPATDASEAPAAAVRYHAGTHEVELHRKETAAYTMNLEGGEPSVYVVIGEPDGDSHAPVRVQLVTVSPDEAQAYGSSGFETVERVAMPPALVPMIAAFVAEHHVEEAFVKRQRTKQKPSEELFGQEPIFVRRRRENADGGPDGGS